MKATVGVAGRVLLMVEPPLQEAETADGVPNPTEEQLTLSTAKAGGCSVLRRGQRHASPKALPEPFEVLGGVVVPRQARAAVRTGMPADRHALRDDDAAATTGLRGRGRRHGDDSTPGPCCLGAEDGQALGPPRVAEARGQVVILDQVGRLHVFVRDRVVLPDQGERRLVVEVGALALDLQRCLGEQPYRFAPPVAPHLASRDPALCHLERPLCLALPAGMQDALASGRRGEGFQPQVDARFLSSSRQRLRRHLGARAADVPTIRFPRHRDRLGRTVNRTGPAHGHPPNLRQDQDTLIVPRAAIIVPRAAMLTDLGRGEGEVKEWERLRP